jgi:hypothetical protein
MVEGMMDEPEFHVVLALFSHHADHVSEEGYGCWRDGRFSVVVQPV